MNYWANYRQSDIAEACFRQILSGKKVYTLPMVAKAGINLAFRLERFYSLQEAEIIEQGGDYY